MTPSAANVCTMISLRAAISRLQWFESLTRQDVVCCISLANLVTFSIWFYLFALADPTLDYFRDTPLDTSVYVWGSVAAVLAWLLLTGSFIIILRKMRDFRGGTFMPLLRAAACALLIIPVYFLSAKMELSSRTTYVLIAGVASTAAILAIGGRGGKLVANVGTTIIVALWPLSIITPASFVWRILSRPAEAAFAASATPGLLPVHSGRAQRLVWIIFDELDEELLFALRPERVHVPEFDRLRSSSLYADEAVAAADFTAVAFPALTTGRAVRSVTPDGPNSLRLNFRDGKTGDWADTPNIFRKLREIGIDAAIAGWHHPFCRVFAEVLSGCAWEMNHDAFSTLRREFVYVRSKGGLGRLAGNTLDAIWGTGPTIKTAEYHILADEQRRQSQRLVGHALDFVADPRYGLVLVHFPVPHPPAISGRKDGNYFDNLMEADSVLGQLRERMVRAGLWDSSAVLVMGDHPLRVHIWQDRPTWTPEEARLTRKRNKLRVPFLLKMPHQTQPVGYAGRFDTLLTHDLILEIIQGRLNDAQATARWMELHQRT
jgi:hypothetical protein